ncbi:protein kinase domain-containing protein [Ideonella sp. YS5]|uniref:protein kinase domain-containing protein n=1 Tax=Ideonella sp. YS5 TaxID=3453714 RepID=UPI003EEF56C7
MTLDPETWQRLSPWLDQVLDLPPGERAAWLDALAEREAGTAAELRALLEGGTAGAAARLLQDAAPAVALQALAGRRIGGYTLIEPLGEGGMGTVWLAERSDGRFEGRAAVKLLHAGLIQRSLAARFRREGAILARLSHPHIARLVDAGLTDDGQPYLVLEHVAGERIDAWCDERRLGLRARVELFDQVLQAVQHAHAQLVVHRDLKPGNVLVDGQGKVKLLDFGIAKLLDAEDTPGEATELTREGGRVLTPHYAAPEQARGETVTTATDVYALGLLLYVLLTGQHPRVDAQGRHAPGTDELPLASRVVVDPARRGSDALQAAASARDTTPARLAHGLAGDLDNILVKALRHEPGERYATAAAFADDLRRHLEGQTVSARPDSWAYRASRFVGRHKAGVALAAGALLAVVTAAGVAEQQRREAERERDLATRQRVTTEAVASFLEEELGQIDEPGRPPAPGDRIELAQRRAEQVFYDAPEVLVQLNALFHNLNVTLGRDGAMRRNVEAIQAAAQQVDDPVVRAQAWCGPEGEMSDAQSMARINRGLEILPAGEGSRGVRSKCLFHRASHLRDTGHYAEALRDLDASFEAAPALQRRMLAAAYQRGRGILLNELGRPYAADQAYSQVAEIMRAAGRDHSIKMVQDLDWRAVFRWRMGRPREALAFVAQAAELARPGGKSAASSPLMTMLKALMLLDLDRRDEALRWLESEQLRDGHLVPIFPRAWNFVAATYQLRGDADAAVAVLERDLAENRGKEEPVVDLINRVALANALLAKHDADRAIAALDEIDAGPELLLLRWDSLWLRARAHNMAGRPVQAEAAARAAIAEAVRRAPPTGRSTLHGQAYLELARALAAQGKAEEARAAADRAAAELADALGPEHSATREAATLARR